MLDIFGMVTSLQRPSLLVEAARLAAESYDRANHLARILGGPDTIRSGEAILRLLETEADLEDRRRARAAGHSLRRHVEVLAAILGESRILRESMGPRLVA